MMLTARTAIAQVLGAFASLEVDVPGPVATAEARRHRLTAAYRGRGHLDAGGLTDAVVAALDAGHDPAEDSDVQRTVTAMALASNHGLPDAVEARLIDDIADTLTADPDVIITAWAAPFTSAAGTLADAYAVLGPVDLDDIARIVAKGGRAADAWGQARAAAATIDTITDAWRALHHLTYRRFPPAGTDLLIIADVTPEQWYALDLDDQPADHWAALGHELPLRLATLDAHRAAVEARNTERTRLAAFAKQRNQDALSGRRVLA